MGSEDTRIAGRRGSAPIPQLAQGVFPLCPFNPAEINLPPLRDQTSSPTAMQGYFSRGYLPWMDSRMNCSRAGAARRFS